MSQIETLEEYDVALVKLGKAAWEARLRVREAQREEDEIMDQMLKLRIRRLEGEFT